jgi:hypothetical protein
VDYCYSCTLKYTPDSVILFFVNCFSHWETSFVMAAMSICQLCFIYWNYRGRHCSQLIILGALSHTHFETARARMILAVNVYFLLLQCKNVPAWAGFVQECELLFYLKHVLLTDVTVEHAPRQCVCYSAELQSRCVSTILP